MGKRERKRETLKSRTEGERKKKERKKFKEQ